MVYCAYADARGAQVLLDIFVAFCLLYDIHVV
jgi:hypothetical protein